MSRATFDSRRPRPPCPTEIGRSAEDQPIRVKWYGSQTKAPRVLIVAGQHGDEPIAREAVQWIAEEKMREVATGLELDVAVISDANPDGGVVRRRNNAQQIDLNRDHQCLQSPETMALHRFVRAWKPHLVVDAHSFASRRKTLLAKGLVYRHDVMLDIASNLAIPLPQRNIAHQLLTSVVSRLNDDGYLADRYTLFRRGGRIRHSTPDVVDARNALALRYQTLTVLLEVRQPAERTITSNRSRTHYAVLVAVSRILQWVADHQEWVLRSLHLPRAGQPVTIGSRYALASVAREMNFSDAATGRPRTIKLFERYTPKIFSTRQITLPKAYAVPRCCERLLDCLDRHGFERLSASGSEVRVEGYCVESVTHSRRANRAPAKLELNRVQPGWDPSQYVLFPVNQVGGRALAVFLEPHSKYGLARLDNFGLPLSRGALFPVLRILTDQVAT